MSNTATSVNALFFDGKYDSISVAIPFAGYLAFFNPPKVGYGYGEIVDSQGNAFNILRAQRILRKADNCSEIYFAMKLNGREDAKETTCFLFVDERGGKATGYYRSLRGVSAFDMDCTFSRGFQTMQHKDVAKEWEEHRLRCPQL